MFSRMMNFVVALGLLTVSAFANSNQGLKAAFDELNYALTTEWDQKDRAFYNEQMSKFNAAVNELRAQGMTNEEMMSFIKTQVKDAKVARDLEAAMNVVKINKMSQDEASAYMLDTMKKSYSAGSSWVSGYQLINLAVLIVALAYILQPSDSETTGEVPPGGYQCYPQYRSEYVCTWVGSNYSCQWVSFWDYCY